MRRMFWAFLALVVIGGAVGAGFWAYERYDRQAERIAQLEASLQYVSARLEERLSYVYGEFNKAGAARVGIAEQVLHKELVLTRGLANQASELSSLRDQLFFYPYVLEDDNHPYSLKTRLVSLEQDVDDLQGEFFSLRPGRNDLFSLSIRLGSLENFVQSGEYGLTSRVSDLEDDVDRLRGLVIIVPGRSDLGGLVRRIADLERAVAGG